MILGRVEFFYRRRRYQIKEFLKNVGSNFILKGKKFDFEPKICPVVSFALLLGSAGKPATTFSNWRKGWDSNPRCLWHIRSPGVPIKPLSHPSLNLYKTSVLKVLLYIKTHFSRNFYVSIAEVS